MYIRLSASFHDFSPSEADLFKKDPGAKLRSIRQRVRIVGGDAAEAEMLREMRSEPEPEACPPATLQIKPGLFRITDREYEAGGSYGWPSFTTIGALIDLGADKGVINVMVEVSQGSSDRRSQPPLTRRLDITDGRHGQPI